MSKIHEMNAADLAIAKQAFVEAFENPMSREEVAHLDHVAKAVTGASTWASASGLQAFNLKVPAALIVDHNVPELDFFQDDTMEPASNIARFKKITAINTDKVGVAVAESAAGSIPKHSTDDVTVTIKEQGLDYDVNQSAMVFGASFENVEATAAMVNQMNFNMGYRDLAVWGNVTDFGTPTAASGVGSGTGGTLAAASYTLYVEELSMTGLRKYQAGGYTGDASGGDLAGHTAPSVASGAVVTTGSTSSIVWTTSRSAKAVASALFVSNDAGATKHFLAVITGAKYTQTTMPSSAVTLNSADESGQSIEFDGAFTFDAAANGTTAIIYDMAGASFTFSAGRCVELDAALENLYNLFGLGVDFAVGQAGVLKDLSDGIGGASGPTQSIDIKGGDFEAKAFARINSYPNDFTGEEIPFVRSRFSPGNTLWFPRRRNPFGYDRIGAPSFRLLTAAGPFNVEWATTRSDGRKKLAGTYKYSALQSFFAGGLIVKNIGG